MNLYELLFHSAPPRAATGGAPSDAETEANGPAADAPTATEGSPPPPLPPPPLPQAGAAGGPAVRPPPEVAAVAAVLIAALSTNGQWFVLQVIQAMYHSNTAVRGV